MSVPHLEKYITVKTLATVFSILPVTLGRYNVLQFCLWRDVYIIRNDEPCEMWDFSSRTGNKTRGDVNWDVINVIKVHALTLISTDMGLIGVILPHRTHPDRLIGAYCLKYIRVFEPLSIWTYDCKCKHCFLTADLHKIPVFIFCMRSSWVKLYEKDCYFVAMNATLWLQMTPTRT